MDTDRRRARAGRGAAGRPRSDGGARSAHRAGAPRRSRRPSTRRGRFHSPKPEPHRRRSARSARRPARSSRVRPSEARNPSRDRASLCGGTPSSCPSPGCPAGRSDTGSRREIERPPVGRGDPEPRRARGSLSAFPSRFLSRSTGEQAVCPDPRKDTANHRAEVSATRIAHVAWPPSPDRSVSTSQNAHRDIPTRSRPALRASSPPRISRNPPTSRSTPPGGRRTSTGITTPRSTSPPGIPSISAR